MEWNAYLLTICFSATYLKWTNKNKLEPEEGSDFLHWLEIKIIAKMRYNPRGKMDELDNEIWSNEIENKGHSMCH